MKTKYYFILLLLCLSQALYAQRIPTDPTGPIPDIPVEPMDPIEWLETGNSVTKRLIYRNAGENMANRYSFALAKPLLVSFDFTDFSYSKGYGSPLPQTTVYLHCHLHNTTADKAELLFSVEVDGITGHLLPQEKNNPVKLAAGFYEFVFSGHSTSFLPGAAKGITPFTSVVPPPTYFLDLQVTVEAVPVKPVYPDPDDEVLPSIPAPDSDILASLRASAGKNSVCTFVSSDGSGDKGQLSVGYADGMGRITEIARTGYTPQAGNLIGLQEYDAWGRKSNTWLEAGHDGAPGTYVSAESCKALASQTNNGDARPYAETVYEASPLNRPVKQYGAGQEWYANGKATDMIHTTNTAAAGELGCLMFTAKAEINSVASVTASGYYPAGSLQVLKTVDEDGKVRLEFTDRNGNIVLQRQTELEGGTLTFYDTYYVYDGIGNLQAVLPPELSAKATAARSLPKAELDKYVYLYAYDSFLRVSGRKLPGAEQEEFIYDDKDRLVFSRDGNLKKEGKWKFTLTDKIGRVCLEGECVDYRFIVDRLNPVRYADCEYIGGPGEYHGYTVDGVTMTEPVFHKVSYYDNYRFLDDGLMPATVADGSFDYVSTPGYGEKYVSAKGRLTGVLTAVYGSAGGFLGGAFYYDERGQLIQSRSSNLLNGLETESVAYNFMGQPVKRLHVHSASGKNTLNEVYTYTYDDTGLPLTTKHQLGNGAETVLSDKVYDALGRLAREKRNGNANLLTGYSYNVRSWLTEISGGKFTQNLNYNTGTGTPCFNGNISSMTWKAGSESTVRGYKFTYDGLNRLTNAAYGETASISSNANHFSEKVTGYDKNGNITALQRYGQTSASGYGLIDNLTFSLNGNQLNRVDDGAGASAYNGGFEFTDAVKQADEYAYDANGNLTKDLNKGIAEIQYNFLNLPSLVTFADGSTIAYLYAADGTKLRTVHTIGGTTTTTDYCGNVIYENEVAKLLLTETGYITLSDKKYHYYLQDHQGNNRVVIDQNGSVEETNHYYPFGGVFASSGNVQPYKYNGKELDAKKGPNWYDYGARHYDAALGRFHTNDRFAEKYYSMSTYQYGANNPVNNIDINGDSIIIKPNSNGIIDQIKEFFGYDTKYQDKVKADLFQLKQDDKKVADIIEELEKSKNIHYITMPKNGEFNSTGIDANKVKKRISQGSEIYYNPYNRKRSRNDNGIRTPRIGLAHELQHSFDVDKKMATYERTKNGILLMDVRAINTENKIRKAIGEPKRTMYGTRKVPEELLE